MRQHSHHHPHHARYPPVPVGAILPYAGPCYESTGEDALQNAQIAANLASAGWLLCAGQTLNRQTYPALFGVIGTAYGSDDDETFKLPDLRAQFLRGVAPGTKLDPGPRTGGGVDGVGSTEQDAFQGHEHTYNQATVTASAPTSSPDGSPAPSSLVTVSPAVTTATDPLDPDGTPRPSAETRPVNIALNFIIRAANPPA